MYSLITAAGEFDPNSFDTTALDGSAAAVGAGIGVFFIFMTLIYIAVIALMIWSWGNLLQAALKISKWNALLLLIPFVNFVMIIIWGSQASKINKGAAPSQQPPQGNVPPPAK